jgi:AbrB family looped-hinge helix DNA binding protein
MATATLTSKGQITIPKEIRDQLKLKPGDRISITDENGRVVLRPKNGDLSKLVGMLHRPGVHRTLEEIDEAIREGAVARLRRASE